MNTEIKRGDKIKPIFLQVKSGSGAIAVQNYETVTARMVGGDLLTIEEKDGIFCTSDFKRVSGPVEHQPAAPVATQSGMTPQPPTANRKSIKKKAELKTGRACEWRDGELYFAGTNEKVPGAPYATKDRPVKRFRE